MSKVFIITENFNDGDTNIVGVFTDEGRAERVLNKKNASREVRGTAPNEFYNRVYDWDSYEVDERIGTEDL